MSLPSDLTEMLAAFAAAGVRYLVVGGHAVSFHARPRTTKDLDVWLDGDRENIQRACEALERFGLAADLVENLRSAKPSEVVWFGKAPLRVDFLQTLPGVKFGESWERRVTANLSGVPVSFIGRDDLIANKRAVKRPRDLRDVRALERAAATASAKAAPRRRRSR